MAEKEMDVLDYELAIKTLNRETPIQMLETLSLEKAERVLGEIIEVLRKNGLSVNQAEFVLDITKGRIRWTKV